MDKIRNSIFSPHFIETREAERNVPKSAYESYSAFVNTRCGYIILWGKEDKNKIHLEERFIIQGINNSKKQVEEQGKY